MSGGVLVPLLLRGDAASRGASHAMPKLSGAVTLTAPASALVSPPA